MYPRGVVQNSFSSGGDILCTNIGVVRTQIFLEGGYCQYIIYILEGGQTQISISEGGSRFSVLSLVYPLGEGDGSGQISFFIPFSVIPQICGTNCSVTSITLRYQTYSYGPPTISLDLFA